MQNQPGSPKKHLLRKIGLIILLVILVLAIFDWWIDGPLTTWMGREMNRSLEGYSVELQEADFQLLGLAVVLKGLTISQDSNPEPPVAEFPRLEANIHWSRILFGRLVAEFTLSNPRLHINLIQLKEEVQSRTPIEERGWQEAVRAIYPLNINHLKIVDGSLTYIDRDPDHPLRLSRIMLDSENIRNIQSPEHVYPSPFHCEYLLFDEGKGMIEGQADFLSEPFPGVKAFFRLVKVPLVPLRPLADRASIFVSDGELSASGQIEYAPHEKIARVDKVQFSNLILDYIHSDQIAAGDLQTEKVQKAAEAVRRKKGTQIYLNELSVTGSTFGFVNKETDPEYRLFITDTEFEMYNFSDQYREGPGWIKLQGLFMGSGAIEGNGLFRPESKGADFDLRLAIINTQLTTMNDFLRAYGNFDAGGGRFSLFAELQARKQNISGYVKPFFDELDVYTEEQEEGESLLQKIYEGVVGGVSEILENPRGKIATQPEISGDLSDPDTSTLQVVAGLVRNAFFDTILPGFEKSAPGKAEKDESQ